MTDQRYPEGHPWHGLSGDWIKYLKSLDKIDADLTKLQDRANKLEQAVEAKGEI